MRITNNILSNNLLMNLQSAQERMDRLQNQLSSGQKITRPSDDPAGIESAMRVKNTMANVEQWKANASEGLSYMDAAESTLAQMGKVLQRVSEIAIEGANGTLTESDREKVAIEIDQIKEHLVQLANTKVGDKYIFGGTANVEPFPQGEAKDASDHWQWAGSDDEVQYPIGSNLTLSITLNGRDVFGVEADAGTGTVTSVGLLDSLEKLSNALKDSDNDAIQESIEELESHSDNVVSNRALLGAKTNRLESIEGQLDATLFSLTKNYSSIMDADVASTMIEFKVSENAYNAALSVGAQIIQPSLVDFMR